MRRLTILVVAVACVAALAPAADAARPRCAGRVATIVGTRGDDVLYGTKRADVIAAGWGHDRV